MQNILVVDDNELTLLHIKTILDSRFKVITSKTKASCIKNLHSEAVHMVLLDLNMPDVENLDLLCYIKENFPLLPIIIISSEENPNTIIKCLKIGAKNYVFKSKITESFDYLLDAIHDVFQESSQKRHDCFKSTIEDNISVFIPDREYELAVKSSRGGLNLVINGETGTGKSFLVHKIHQEIAPNSPLISVNCASISSSLVESELFGYEKGAFTDATSTKIGKIEAANGGILFLDEIGKMPTYVQEKLLTVIESKQFFRVGSTVATHVEFQLISATNANLEELVEKGEFLKDLYYRIQQFSLTMPPLRRSKDYILNLTDYFIKVFNHKYNCNFSLTKELHHFLITHPWNGNIRELKNKLQTIIAMFSQGETVSITPYETQAVDQIFPIDIQNYERSRLLEALKQSNNNLSKASRLLHIPRSTLQGKIKKYKIEVRT